MDTFHSLLSHNSFIGFIFCTWLWDFIFCSHGFSYVRPLSIPACCGVPFCPSLVSLVCVQLVPSLTHPWRVPRCLTISLHSCLQALACLSWFWSAALTLKWLPNHLQRSTLATILYTVYLHHKHLFSVCWHLHTTWWSRNTKLQNGLLFTQLSLFMLVYLF